MKHIYCRNSFHWMRVTQNETKDETESCIISENCSHKIINRAYNFIAVLWTSMSHRNFFWGNAPSFQTKLHSICIVHCANHTIHPTHKQQIMALISWKHPTWSFIYIFAFSCCISCSLFLVYIIENRHSFFQIFYKIGSVLIICLNVHCTKYRRNARKQKKIHHKLEYG